jgi:hypothetical protein
MKLLIALALLSQINVPDRVDPYAPIVATCDVQAAKGSTISYSWDSDDGTKLRVDGGNRATACAWAPPGAHSLKCVAVIQSFTEMVVWVPDTNSPNDISKAKLQTIKLLTASDVKSYNKSFTVGDPAPTPPPGPTPTPGPGPNPPPPNPAPGTISVLLIDETQKIGRAAWLPYNTVLNSTRVRDYLNSHVAKGPGGLPEWRLYDKDTDLTNEAKKWQDAIKLPRAPSLPITAASVPPEGDGDFWVIISNGQSGYSGPMPQSEDALLALLKQWGGP